MSTSADGAPDGFDDLSGEQERVGRAAAYRHRGTAILSSRPGAPSLSRQDWRSELAVADLHVAGRGRLEVVSWGGLEPALAGSEPTFLACQPRRSAADLTVGEAFTAGSRARPGLAADVLPPCAALRLSDDTARAAVDGLGFSHLYVRAVPGGAGLSTSARALGLLGDAGLSRAGVAVQSLMGWQLGTSTMFDGVRKLPAGGSATLRAGTVAITAGGEALPELHPRDPAKAAAQVLRRFVNAYLDDHPDAELQLTGGLDSRILLAAVPPTRRRQLGVMTLTVPGSEDTAIAGELAARYGLRHRLASFAGLAGLSPEEAFALSLVAARRVDSAADPLALAAVDFAELAMESRPRIAGLGGEFARGFYYFGPVTNRPVTRQRVSRLARWRMFTNEAAPLEMLEPEFAGWAQESAIADVHAEFQATGLDWFRAMDEFYLGQRMQRWAGVLASANALERVVVNPMLDWEFLAIARGVPPEAKKNARFLSQILMALDPELGSVRMDGRPPPATYARPTVQSRARVAATTAAKVVRKVRQRASRTQRSPVGGELLSVLVTEHLRRRPELLDGVAELGLIDRGWLDEMVSGTHSVAVSAVSLLVNLLATRPQR